MAAAALFPERMTMKKVKCKARCIRCKRVFVTTNIDKLFMRYYTAVICPRCEDEFASQLVDNIFSKITCNKDEVI